MGAYEAGLLSDAHIFRNIHGDLLQTALPQGDSSCRMYSSKSGESTLLATWLIPVMFYTYSGILGFNVAFIDIAIFFISVLFAFIHLWKLQNNDDCGCYGFLIIVVVQLIIFFVFTSKPPALGLFIPPLG